MPTLVNIIPITNLPPNTNQVFSYLSSQNLKLGQEVIIPFSGKNIAGIVDLTPANIKQFHFKPKNILKIIENSLLTKKQIELAKFVADYYHTSLGQVLRIMLPKKILPRKKEKILNTKLSPIVKLTPEQNKIYNNIKTSKQNTFLIHGVTGSGKTEIYLHLIKDQIEKNKQSIVLIPEIALTSQTIMRFTKHFKAEEIAILNSRLSEGEKYIQWLKIKQNVAKIIIGPRSAIFAPIQNLGIIIIDEEHDSSFKQYDQKPRYHTITVAKKLADLYQAKLVLGSATPDIISYYNTEQQKCSLQTLPSRYTSNQQMPKIKIIDMREEFKKRNYSIFSLDLQDELEKIIKNNRQAILFINRRGASTFVMCRDCGYVLKCKNCDVPMAYHAFSRTNFLFCHHCGHKTQNLTLCPNCQSHAIKYFGAGTQKVESELQKLYKYVKIFRMDSDTTKSKNAHSQIYHDFRLKKANILIGTQMITKGWDLPEIDLIGVIASDIGLNLPDYRSSEKTFQLLTQVAGRTGRGHFNPGKVIFQTYNPDNFVIKTAAKHDYKTFYLNEIKTRQKLNYPPFCKLVKLIYKHENPVKSKKQADLLTNKLNQLLTFDFQPLTLLGPSPSFYSRIRNKYIWQIILKIKPNTNIKPILKIIPSDWIIDIDPESLL